MSNDQDPRPVYLVAGPGPIFPESDHYFAYVLGFVGYLVVLIILLSCIETLFGIVPVMWILGVTGAIILVAALLCFVGIMIWCVITIFARFFRLISSTFVK